MERKWVTPFLKQCFVTAGVGLNMGQVGLVMAYTAVLLPQLKRPDSVIPIDDSSASWIASIPGLALIIGNFTVPTLMAKYGRKKANLISVAIVSIGWLCIAGASSITVLLTARVLQGVSIGMITSLGSILVGEYTSPANRGSFLSTLSLFMSMETLTVHTVGSYFSWNITAYVCASLSLLNLIIVIFSPESPSWLADQGRYEDCEKVFLWLRGKSDGEELRKMIETNQVAHGAKTEARVVESYGKTLRRLLVNFISTLKKKEFYKPIIIVVHMYIFAHWGGINLLAAFTLDTIHRIIGTDKYDTVVTISLDVQRLISSSVAVFIARRLKRRTLLLTTTFVNIAALFIIGSYALAKTKGLLPVDHPMIGIMLMHIHMLSIAMGTLPLPLMIAGEVFPMRFKSFAGGISSLFFSLNMFTTTKTVLVLFKNVGLYGAYFIYGSIMTYGVVVTWFVLPETKDRTLQDIEEEFRGKKLSPEEKKEAESLNILD